MNREWLKRHLDAAFLAASWSKDTTKVGAVLTSGKAVLPAAYNGPPAGVQDLPERFVRPAKYLFCSHAEQNLVAFAAKHGLRTDGLHVTVTHHPCADCCRLLIAAGIRAVFVGPGSTSMPAETFEASRIMFAEAGVTVETIECC